MICESTQELIPQGMFVSCGNQVKKRTKNVCSDFWNKFGKKTEGAMTDSRERTADTLYNDLESVALTIEGTNPDVTEDGNVRTTEFIQDTKKRQLVTRSGLQILRGDVWHLLHKQTMTAPTAVQQFFKTVLQQVHHFKVDVIAGDVNTTACRYYKKQVFQDLCNSSVVVMLREMQREVNTERPFESRLHIVFLYQNHFSQFRSASDLDYYYMTILSWRKPLGPRIMRTHSGAIRVSERRVTRDVRSRERRQSHDCTWRLWCPSIWKSLGAPQQRSLDKSNRSVLTLPYSCDYSWVSFRNYRGRSSGKLKVREDEIEEVKNQNTLKNKDEDWNSVKRKQTWTWTTISSSSSSAWREWRSDQTREYSDWQSPADWNSSDQTRERSDWQSADLDSSDQARETTTWQSYCTWQWNHLHRSSQGHPWRRKWRLCVTEYIFSSFLSLVFLLWETCETVIVPFHSTRMNLFRRSLSILFLTVWLKATQLVYTLSEFIHVRCDEKGSSLRLSL